MLRRDDDERHAVNRIGTGRVDRQLLSQGGHVKAEFQPFGTANPVFLHDLDPIRPAGDFLHVLQEFIGIFRNLEEPLAQALLVDFVMAAPAFPSSTCSLARTVLQWSHQLTDDSF